VVKEKQLLPSLQMPQISLKKEEPNILKFNKIFIDFPKDINFFMKIIQKIK